MRKYYKKKYKNKYVDLILPLSFLVSIFIYSKTLNLSLALWVFVGCIFCFVSIILYRSYLNQKKLMDSGIYVVDKMSGDQFEEYILAHFKVLGYSGYVTRGSQDYGADVVIEKDGIITVIQAKRWKQKVSIDAVQQIVAAVKHYKAHKALVITNNFFTSNAIELAKSNQVELWDRNKLIDILIDKSNPVMQQSLNLDIQQLNDIQCPKCGMRLIKREGKNGCFLGCSGFPKCRYTRNM